jgi:hypothetical protein
VRRDKAMTRAKLFLAVATAISLTGSLIGGVESARAADPVLVSVGSPTTPFPQSWQNAPALAVDAAHPNVVAAAAQDAIDTAPCAAGDPTFCPFRGVGFDGAYFSFDGGGTWTQPTYTGLTCRNYTGEEDDCIKEVGPIGTVPNQDRHGFFSIYFPSVAFGPVLGPDGVFSWANGSRLYYADRVQNLDPDDPAFEGGTAVAVSRIDGQPALTPDLVAAQDNWMDPVIVTHQKPNLGSGSDGLAVWADNAQSSPYFGNTYVCNAAERNLQNTLTVQVNFDRSADGGNTWKELHLSEAVDADTGSEGVCSIRTDSKGTVYVFWVQGWWQGHNNAILARSFDGGKTFEVGRKILLGERCGPDEDIDFDGAFGTEGSVRSSVDIANGAPTGADATDQIVFVVCDSTRGINNERALMMSSTDGGDTWSKPVDVAQSGDRANTPTIAISPDGHDAYLVYQGYLDPFRESLADPRREQAVVRHADASDLSTWTTMYRGPVSDARASSWMSSFMRREYLGFYQAAVATRNDGILLWTDIRNAARCPAIERWRQSIVDDPDNPLPTPAPNTDCPPTFGNSDIYGAAVADPTP